MKNIKKLMIWLMIMVVSISTVNIRVNALEENKDLKPGEVTQEKSVKWTDYEQGIAEITFDVKGKNAEEPIDVVLVYDNSGSMQNSNPADGGYSTSRWNYASVAAKTFTKELLKNKDNNIAFVPFSDKLIDGNSKHSNPIEFFETHEYIYDENGNPDINTMKWIVNYYQDFEQGFISQEEFVAICEEYFQINPLQLAKKNNTKNAMVPFTKDETKINDAIDGLYPAHLGTTNYEVALEGAKEALAKSDSERKIVVMISDGKPDLNKDGIQVANEIKASGATIYTCGTGLKSGEEETLKQIASKENNVPLYFSSNPEDLTSTLEKMRKQFEVAAHDGVIEDEINTNFFEYYSDETHKPSVNGIEVGDSDIIVSQVKGHITWKIGNITEKNKVLKFYVKVKDTLLNEDLLSSDGSLLNQEGSYSTNLKANLIYKDINTDKIIDTGHEMSSPKLDVSTASLQEVYYLSDKDGNIIKNDGRNIVLKSNFTNNKALHVKYEITPEKFIEIDGVLYEVYREDNKSTEIIITEAGYQVLYTCRYVEVISVTFDTNGFGDIDGNTVANVYVDQESGKVNSVPTVNNVPSNMYFTGWNTQADGNGIAFNENTIIDKNTTLYAQYAYNPVSVVFKDEDGTIYQEGLVQYGKNAIAPNDPVKEGFTFDGWDIDFTNVKTDLVVLAKWVTNDTDLPVDPELPVDPGVPTPPITPVTPALPVVPVPVPNVNQNTPVVTPPQTITPTPEEVVDNETPLTDGQDVEKVEKDKTPLSKGTQSWALINLLCVIATIVLILFIFLGKRKKEEEEEEEITSYQRRNWTKVSGVVIALVSLIAFIITEDMTLPMILIDKWTIMMALILLVQCVNLYLTKKWKEDSEDTTVKA